MFDRLMIHQIMELLIRQLMAATFLLVGLSHAAHPHLWSQLFLDLGRVPYAPFIIAIVTLPLLGCGRSESESLPQNVRTAIAPTKTATEPSPTAAKVNLEELNIDWASTPGAPGYRLPPEQRTERSLFQGKPRERTNEDRRPFAANSRRWLNPIRKHWRVSRGRGICRAGAASPAAKRSRVTRTA